MLQQLSPPGGMPAPQASPRAPKLSECLTSIVLAVVRRTIPSRRLEMLRRTHTTPLPTAQLLPWALALCLAIPAAAGAVTVTRGPYLQLASDTKITVVWRTDTAGIGRVRFGTSQGAL